MKVLLINLVGFLGIILPFIGAIVLYKRWDQIKTKAKETEVKIEPKKVYEIVGPIVAYALFHIIWLIWSWETLKLASQTAPYWIFHILFLVINLGLLGRTGITVLCVRAATLILMIFALVSVALNFVEGGPEFKADVHYSVKRATISHQVIKITSLEK